MSSVTESSNAYTTKSKQTHANWAILNPDLLYFISKKLCDASDFIIFRAVCKGWRSATNISDPPPQFPCLLEWPCDTGSTLHTFSLASQRTHTFCYPNTSFSGPAGDSVMIQNDSVLQLSYLNPFTKVRKGVSFVDKVSPMKPYHVGLSLRPEESFMVSCRNSDVFFFKRPGEDRWNGVKSSDLRSAAYYRNQCFLLRKDSVDFYFVIINEYDTAKVSPIPFPVKGFCYNYVVTTTEKELLAVGASLNGSNSRFEVHRLDNYPQKPQWTKLNGIGDSMLFVDHRGCFSLNASDYSGFKGNSIYFVSRSLIDPECNSKHSLRRFDMEINESVELPGPSWSVNSAVQAAWFVPSMLPEPPRNSSITN